MSEPIIKEMLCYMEYAKNQLIIADAWNELEDIYCDEAIRRLIENMGKKVSREFVERWEDNFAQDIGESGSPKFIGPSKKGLARMLTELGHEVEEGR